METALTGVVEGGVPRRRSPGEDLAALHDCLEDETLATVFQPILELANGRVFGYEALTRGPAGSRIATAEALFGTARRAGLGGEIERLAARLAVKRFASSGSRGKLFVNFSPAALEAQALSGEEIADYLEPLGVSTSQVVIELTEQESMIGRSATAWSALLRYRELGFEIAIDDLGEGFASLRLWSELRPEYVKVDRHFIDGISHDPLKLQITRAIQQIAHISGSKVLAEGIEEAADFMAVRDLGMRLGQGYFIARPMPTPDEKAATRIWEETSGRPVKAFPEPVGPLGRVTARRLMQWVEPMLPSTENDVVFARFERAPELRVIPVVEDGRPRGLINRAALIDRFARPYRRELFGKRPCTMFMEARPVVVEADTSLQDIGFLFAEATGDALADGFIITENGRYVGVGSGPGLMREITEQQLVAARYANPLTLLPGNVPTAQHVERLIAQGCRFAACYCDLDNFKPYNDVYGYQRGDEAIQLTAKVLLEACSAHYDFVGHIGGDDFVVIFQSEDWEPRCRAALEVFAARVRLLFSPEDAARGSFDADDRKGQRQQFALTSLSIGAVAVEPRTYGSHYEVAAAATEAKKQAKRIEGNSLFIERRNYPPHSIRPPAR